MARNALRLENFLQSFLDDFVEIVELQNTLPKTATELLRAVSERGLAAQEANKMAAYLREFVEHLKFKNVAAFDENTSHIIGREWHEIDYSGEGMTWQGQKEKYARFGITHFKSLTCLVKFLAVEAKLPYFRRVYGATGNIP